MSDKSFISNISSSTTSARGVIKSNIITSTTTKIVESTAETSKNSHVTLSVADDVPPKNIEAPTDIAVASTFNDLNDQHRFMRIGQNFTMGDTEMPIKEM